jgi:hypothetical protein
MKGLDCDHVKPVLLVPWTSINVLPDKSLPSEKFNQNTLQVQSKHLEVLQGSSRQFKPDQARPSQTKRHKNVQKSPEKNW